MTDETNRKEDIERLTRMKRNLGIRRSVTMLALALVGMVGKA